MPRTLTAGMETAIAAERSSIVHLVEINTSGGTTRFTTAPQDISWDSQTWTAVGGALTVGEAAEAADKDAAGMPLQLSGVDTAVISIILGNHLRGREIRVWRAHLDESTGVVVADPLEIFRGYQNEAYEIEETRSEGLEGGTCRVRTRVTSRLTRLRDARPVRTNTVSHDAMLARAGLAVGDTFFVNTPQIVNVPIYWGTTAPVRWGAVYTGESFERDPRGRAVNNG